MTKPKPNIRPGVRGIVEDLPTVPSQKPAPSNAPIYAVIYPGLATIARQHGYALAVHGSMQRDFDLVAVPWTEHPSEPDVVVKEFTTEFDLRVVGDIGHKLHHRTVYSISLSGNCAIDLSFMPTVPSPQQKSYWRLLEVGEVVQRGDEAWDQERAEWQKIKPYFHGVRPDPRDIYRRRVPAPSGHFVPAEHYVPPAEFEQLKADAAKWREIERRSVEAGCDIDAQADGWCRAWQLRCQLRQNGELDIDGNAINKLLHWMQQAHEDAAKWREHVASPQPAPQIPGMPDGWEVDPDNEGFQNTYNCYVQIPIRRIKPSEPICVWQHGVFRDGWLCPGKDKGMFRVHEYEPVRDEMNEIFHSLSYYLVDGRTMLNPPKFRDDLPWDQRCVKVGPEAEKGLSCP